MSPAEEEIAKNLIAANDLVTTVLDKERQRVAAAVALIERYGSIGGEHHKQWVIDQVLRLLLDDKYEAWLKDRNSDAEYAPWDEGVAP